MVEKMPLNANDSIRLAKRALLVMSTMLFSIVHSKTSFNYA